MSDPFSCTGLTIFTERWAAENGCRLLGLSIMFDRECGTPWGPVQVPNEAALAEVIEAMRPPFISVCAAEDENVEALKVLVEFASLEPVGVVH
jgi:hypothetical protein